MAGVTGGLLDHDGQRPSHRRAAGAIGRHRGRQRHVLEALDHRVGPPGRVAVAGEHRFDGVPRPGPERRGPSSTRNGPGSGTARRRSGAARDRAGWCPTAPPQRARPARERRRACRRRSRAGSRGTRRAPPSRRVRCSGAGCPRRRCREGWCSATSSPLRRGTSTKPARPADAHIRLPFRQPVRGGIACRRGARPPSGQRRRRARPARGLPGPGPAGRRGVARPGADLHQPAGRSHRPRGLPRALLPPPPTGCARKTCCTPSTSTPSTSCSPTSTSSRRVRATAIPRSSTSATAGPPRSRCSSAAGCRPSPPIDRPVGRASRVRSADQCISWIGPPESSTPTTDRVAGEAGASPALTRNREPSPTESCGRRAGLPACDLRPVSRRGTRDGARAQARDPSALFGRQARSAWSLVAPARRTRERTHSSARQIPHHRSRRGLARGRARLARRPGRARRDDGHQDGRRSGDHVRRPGHHDQRHRRPGAQRRAPSRFKNGSYTVCSAAAVKAGKATCSMTLAQGQPHPHRRVQRQERRLRGVDGHPHDQRRRGAVRRQRRLLHDVHGGRSSR